MPESKNEANDFDSRADTFLDKEVTETPATTSIANKPEDDTARPEMTPGAEPEKTEQVKKVEADSSLSVGEKIAKIKEILGDDEKALDAYIKQKGYHNDPAWQKQREKIERLKQEAKANFLSDEDRKALEEFKNFRSSAEYIQTFMRAQGFTQEAIDKKLKEAGFDVKSTPQDDIQMVISKLGINIDDMNEEDRVRIRNNISDVVRIAEILINDRLGKILPKELEPLQGHLQTIEQSENATKLANLIKKTVNDEGVLDYGKDIEPALYKFLDENPDATQQDVFEHFKSIYHTMTVERLKVGKRKEERDDKKTSLRQNIPISGSPPGVPKKTGNFDKDADAFLETINI